MDVDQEQKTTGLESKVGGQPLQGLPGAAVVMPATVSGGNPEAEVSVIAEQQWRAIQDRRAAGMSVSGIARELDLDRKTVRTALKRTAWAPYQREASAPTLLHEHRGWLIERAPQVHYSARILHQELTRERGFRGCYETVKLAVRPLRSEAALAALTQRRFETGPGEQAQCDWGQVKVPLSGVRRCLHVFVMTLGYSRRGFAMGFEGERMPDLLAAHEAAFAYFGGRCEQLLYDRMRTVVLGSSNGQCGQVAPELDVLSLCRALGVCDTTMSAVSRADQRQGRIGSEVREAQLRSRAHLPEPGGLQRPVAHLAA
jgi:transposase